MPQRRANFDLIRVITMVGIIMYHHFGNKTPIHFVQLTNGFTHKHFFYDYINNIQSTVRIPSLLMDFCYGHFGNGGNLVFMLITGYFLFGRDISFGKRVRSAGKILYAIIFYGTILTLIYFVILKVNYPFSFYKGYKPLFKLPNWISGDNLWYLQAYGIFILLMLPLLKQFEEKLTQKTHLYLALTLVFIHFLAFWKYVPYFWFSKRIINFTMCYYVGGYISKYRYSVSSKKLIPMICAYCMAYFAYEYYWRYSCSTLYAPAKYSYVSVMQPFICCLIYSVLLFLFANNLRIQGAIPTKILSVLSSATLGIYIFHYNMISISFLLANQYWWHDWSLKKYFLFVIIDSILLFLVGFCLDMIRQKTYKHVESFICKNLVRQ